MPEWVWYLYGNEFGKLEPVPKHTDEEYEDLMFRFECLNKKNIRNESRIKELTGNLNAALADPKSRKIENHKLELHIKELEAENERLGGIVEAFAPQMLVARKQRQRRFPELNKIVPQNIDGTSYHMPHYTTSALIDHCNYTYTVRTIDDSEWGAYFNLADYRVAWDIWAEWEESCRTRTV
jgi:hypothetical protein